MTQKWSCSRTHWKLACSSGISASSVGRQQPVVLLQRFQNRAGRQIQLGQAAAVVLHLFDELQRRLPVRQNRAPPRPV